jgi:hypothetical protein
MKKLFLILGCIIPGLLYSQSNYESLRFGDVRYTWSTQQGSIDNVSFEIKPRGAYAEVGMYFDFSVRGTNYVEGDSLEIQMMFDLPDDAEVTDMWLWVGTTIVQADMYDKWTGSKIYEDIVARRVDPAILYKYRYCYYYNDNCETYYSFRIFPLMTDLPRKAKITFLLPIDNHNSARPSISLPFNILKLSKLPILNTKIRIFDEDQAGFPFIIEKPAICFNSISDPVNGDGYEVDLTNLSGFSSLNISYPNPDFNKVFASTFTHPTSGEKYFMIQATPSDVFGIKNSKKALILVDFIDALCTQFDVKQFIDALRFQVYNMLDDKDSFNVMFAGNYIRMLSNNWIPADSASVDSYFSSIQTSYFNSTSYLPLLLAEGINFIKNHQNDGTIILLASSKSHGDNITANNLLDDIKALMDKNKVQIHVYDLFDYRYSYEYHRIGNQYYYGNGYLYSVISMLYAGDYASILDETFNEFVPGLFSKLGKYFNYIDLYAKPESGFTFSRYNLGNNSGFHYYDEPIQMIGKYNGSGRFRITMNAESPTGQLYSYDQLLDYSQMTSSDSIIRTLWGAQYLRELSQYSVTNQTISQIIYQSMKYRVLSDYTAFLALEPAIGPLPSEETTGGGTDINENNVTKDIEVSIYPNPFVNSTLISIKLPSHMNVTAEVYDIFGKRVHVLINEKMLSGNYELSFDGSGLPAGTYILKISTDKGKVFTYKMLLSR